MSESASRQKAGAAAEAFANTMAREPGSVAARMEGADFALERFGILDLELKSAPSGMEVVSRFEAQGLDRGTERW